MAAELTLTRSPRTQAGFNLLEVLVALFIITVGLLGLAGMQVAAQQAELEAYQRAQAMVLMNSPFVNEGLMPAFARFRRVSAHRFSARFVTTTTRPPSSCTVRVNATAPGSAGAIASRTNAIQLAPVKLRYPRSACRWK